MQFVCKTLDCDLLQPVLSFDLGSPVGDVAWAPFSSTVFAAVTDSGKVFVFDVSQNMHKACCVQKVGRGCCLHTHIAGLCHGELQQWPSCNFPS
jgi:hypothetical protein